MNNTLHHLNYQHYPQASSSAASDQQLNHHQVIHTPIDEEEMLQMQTPSRSTLAQFPPYGPGFFDMYMPQYPAPSPPAPASGPSLLNDQEYNTLNGFLEHISDFSLLQDPKLLLGDWDDEPPNFHTQGSSQLQSFLGNALQTPSNNINGLGDSISPTISSTTTQQPSPPQPIIVNPFHEAHGLVPQSATSQSVPDTAALSTLAWGSDPHFAHSGYHPPLPPVTTDQDIQRKVLSIMTLEESAGNTVANSPAEVKYERIGEDIGANEMGNGFRSGSTQLISLLANQNQGLKRRAEEDEDLQQQHPRKARNRKELSNEPTPKKRGGKRDQLTEAEKRANHIHSEQKRRNQIKHGFDTLTEMVPELKGGGYSKSAVLQHAAVYVANLQTGNARLREILRELEDRATAVGHGHGPGRGHQL